MIYRSFLLIACVGLLAVSSLSQQPTPSPEKWRVLQPENEEFSIDSPVEMAIDGGKEPKHSRKYRAQINGTYIYVFSDPLIKVFSDPIKSADCFGAVRRFVESNGKTLDISNELQTVTRLSFEDAFGYWQNIALVKTESRIYVAQTVSIDKNDPVANRFVSSFGLGKHFFAPEKSAAPKVSVAGSGDQTGSRTGSGSGQGNGVGSGSGSGLGSGSGSGGGIGTGPPSPIQPQESRPLRILSKPKPAYTDFAMFYYIEGTVRLRVTFMANGSIGSISPASRLPFGLSDQAILAAKGLRFEPAIQNGTAVTVTKTVEYTFSFY